MQYSSNGKNEREREREQIKYGRQCSAAQCNQSMNNKRIAIRFSEEVNQIVDVSKLPKEVTFKIKNKVDKIKRNVKIKRT